MPAGQRVVFRRLTARNYYSGSQVVYFGLGGGITYWTLVLAASGTSGDSLDWSTWIVLGPGATIQLAVQNAGGAAVTVSGSTYTI